MPTENYESNIASDRVLQETPGRSLTFLRAIANNPVIHAQVSAAGFTGADYQEGWNLLHSASGYTESPPPVPQKSAAFNAMQELDTWDEDGFRRIRAALERLHPEQAAFVFAGGLSASTGPAAVVGVKTLLDRLDELENGKDRKATRKADQAALKTLEQRGISSDERARLRALVVTAQSLEAAPPLPTPKSPVEKQAALAKLYAWYKDWAETARSVVKKRAHLITLGLAKRKSAKGAEPEAPAAPDKPQ